jgi:cytochrome c oxidase subunit 2
MAIAIALVLIVVGSVLFHFWSPWWFTPVASNWGSIDDIIIITFVITGLVFAAVVLFMAYAIYKFRHKEGRRADYEPENKKLEFWLTIATTAGVIGLLAPGLVVWADFVIVPEGAAEVEAVGEQWQWTYRFPGADGKLGTTDATNITYDNPFGMNSDDPDGQDDVLIEDYELHLPIGSPIKVLLRSKDVLHDFYVPQFRAKMDIVPGLVSYFWFTPTREGTFDLICAELCGTGHYNMKGKVTVESEAAFQAWLTNYPTYAETMPTTGEAVASTVADAGLGQ